MRLCIVQADWSLQQSADLTGCGRSCVAQARGQRGWRGQGGTASQQGGQHPPVCPAALRGPQQHPSQLSVLLLLMGWEESWRWDCSCTAVWTQVRPNTRCLQLSPWRHLQSRKTLRCLPAQGELQPFRKERLSIEVNMLLLALSFQELDSQICLVFPFLPLTELVKSNTCFGGSCALLFLRLPQRCCPERRSTAHVHSAGPLLPYYILNHVFNIYRSFCPHLHYNFAAHHKCKMSFTSSSLRLWFIAFT